VRHRRQIKMAKQLGDARRDAVDARMGSIEQAVRLQR
jgi:hypothetical protein